MSTDALRARWRQRRRLACFATLILLCFGLLHLASHHPQPQPQCKGCQTLTSPLLSPAAPGIDRPALVWSAACAAPDRAPVDAGSRCLSPLRAPPASVAA